MAVAVGCCVCWVRARSGREGRICGLVRAPRVAAAACITCVGGKDVRWDRTRGLGGAAAWSPASCFGAACRAGARVEWCSGWIHWPEFRES